MRWRKSTFSGNDANCVEIAWRKSSFSAGDANCVELAWGGVAAAIRDSKNPDAGRLDVSAHALASLVAVTKQS
jgi:hypothetical protein